MKDKFTETELRAAYEMCILVKHNSDNVLASGETSKSDVKWSRMATKFIKAYESVNATKLAKQGKAGSLGKALILLDGMSKSIKEISNGKSKRVKRPKHIEPSYPYKSPGFNDYQKS